MSAILPKNIHSVIYNKSINNYFVKARIYRSLRKFPFGIWNSIDKFANVIINKPTRLIVDIKK